LLFLKNHFKDVDEVERLSYYYHNNKVSYLGTVFQAIINARKLMTNGFYKVKKIVADFRPDIIITDFEVFTSKVANINRIPLISIDNITMVSLTRTPNRFSNYIQSLATRLVVNLFVSNANHYFITTFFTAPLRNRNQKDRISFVPAILREEIISAKLEVRQHVLVYQTTQTNKDLIPALLGCKNDSFIYYGYNEDKILGNITFKKFSEKDFIEDFASCKALITNGGFTMISEAIYLNKPILSNPIGGQYEQYVNAVMLEKEGFGKKVDKISTEKIKEFFASLPRFRSNLGKCKHDKNKTLFSKLDHEIKKILN
jgi:uncharacterized protein (TIGR00661 family)